jgi:hypothetical protein
MYHRHKAIDLKMNGWINERRKKRAKELGKARQLRYRQAVRVHLSFQDQLMQSAASNLCFGYTVLLGEDSCTFSVLEYIQQKFRDIQSALFHEFKSIGVSTDSAFAVRWK